MGKKFLPHDEWIKTLPSKRMAVQVIFTNLEYEVLFVKTNYRDDWILPGGIIEAGESPLQAAFREVKEELGFDINYMLLAGVDYKPDNKGLDFLHIFFYGGVLSDEQVASFSLQDDEIDKFRWVDMSGDTSMINPDQVARVKKFASSTPGPIYLDDGQLISLSNNAVFDPQYIFVVGGVMVVKDGKYLIIQERQTLAYGLWQFPGGLVDAGETVEQAAIRETKEEVGLDIELGELLTVHHLGTKAPVVHTYVAKKFSGEVKVQESEIIDHKWVSLDELKQMKDELRKPEIMMDAIRKYEDG